MPCHLLARPPPPPHPPVNAQSELEPVLAKSFPWCIGWAEELKQLFAAYVDTKQAQNVLEL